MCLVESHWITSRKKWIAQWSAVGDATSIIGLVLSQFYANGASARHWRNLTMCDDRGETVLHSLILPSLAAMMTLQVLVGVATRSETLSCGCIVQKMKCLLVRLLVVQQCTSL